MSVETPEARVERLVLEYGDFQAGRPLEARLSLKDDLAIESLSLVSLTLRLANEYGIDELDSNIELGNVKTIGDLLRVAHTLSALNPQDFDNATNTRRIDP